MAFLSYNIGTSAKVILINNDIVMTCQLGGTSGYVERFELTFSNFETGATTDAFVLYPIGNSITVNIAPMIKAIFTEPTNITSYSATPTVNKINANRITVNIKCYYVEDEENKVFNTNMNNNYVRGGRRESYSGTQTLAVGDNLRTTELIPVWPGYPVSKYTINSESYIDRTTVFEDAEIMNVRTCYPLYVKFLNSLGGYSYWLFEQSTIDENNDNLGVIPGYNTIKDLGNTVDINQTAYSKVPKRYLSIIRDLISSPQIYVFIPNTTAAKSWKRVTSDNNRVTIQENKDVSEVKIKLQNHNNYNPAIVW